jgi:hypothetical protein
MSIKKLSIILSIVAVVATTTVSIIKHFVKKNNTFMKRFIRGQKQMGNRA